MNIRDSLSFIANYIDKVKKEEIPSSDAKVDRILRGIFEEAIDKGLVSKEDRGVKRLKHYASAISQHSKEEQLNVLQSVQDVFIRSYCSGKIEKTNTKECPTSKLETFLKRCNLKATKENIDFLLKIASSMDPRRFAAIEDYIVEEGAGINLIFFAGDEKKQREVIRVVFRIFSTLSPKADDDLVFLLKMGDVVYKKGVQDPNRFSWLFSIEELTKLEKGMPERMLTLLTKTLSSVASHKEAHSILCAALRDINDTRLTIFEKIPSVLNNFSNTTEHFLFTLEDVSPKSERGQLLEILSKAEGKIDYSAYGPFLLFFLSKNLKNQREALSHFFSLVQQSTMTAEELGYILGKMNSFSEKEMVEYLLGCAMCIRAGDDYGIFDSLTSISLNLGDIRLFKIAVDFGRMLSSIPKTDEYEVRKQVTHYFLNLDNEERTKATSTFRSLLGWGVFEVHDLVNSSLSTLQRIEAFFQKNELKVEDLIDPKWALYLQALLVNPPSEAVERFILEALKVSGGEEGKVLSKLASLPKEELKFFYELSSAALFAPVTAEQIEKLLKHILPGSKIQEGQGLEIRKILDKTSYSQDLESRIYLAVMMAGYSEKDATEVAEIAKVCSEEHHISFQDMMRLALHQGWSVKEWREFASFINVVDPDKELFQGSHHLDSVLTRSRLSFSEYERIFRLAPCTITTLGGLRHWMGHVSEKIAKKLNPLMPYFNALNVEDAFTLDIARKEGYLDDLEVFYGIVLSLGFNVDDAERRRLAVLLCEKIIDVDLVQRTILPLCETCSPPLWLIKNIDELIRLFSKEDLVEIARLSIEDTQRPLISICQQSPSLSAKLLDNLSIALQNRELVGVERKKLRRLALRLDQLKEVHENTRSNLILALVSKNNELKIAPKDEKKILCMLDENPKLGLNIISHIAHLATIFDDESLQKIARMSLDSEDAIHLVHEILRQDPALQAVLYRKLLRDLGSSPDRQKVQYLSSLILSGKIFILKEEDPLYQEALGAHIRLEQPPRNNPYDYFEKLCTWSETPDSKKRLFTEKIADHSIEINKEGVSKSAPTSISKEQYVAVCKKALAEEDLANLVGSFRKRVDALGPQEQDDVKRYVEEVSQMGFSSMLDNLYSYTSPTYFQLELSSPLEEKVPQVRAQLGAILAMIEQQDSIPRPGQLLSDQEEMLMRFSSSAQYCSGGKKEGIALFYSNLDEKYRFALASGLAMTEGQTTAHHLACDLFFRAIEDCLSSRSGVVKRLCRDQSQLSHIAIYLKNVLFPVLGISKGIVFDPYIVASSLDLLECSKEKIVSTFFECFSLKPVVEQLQKIFLENQRELAKVAHEAHSSHTVKSLFDPFSELLQKEGFDDMSQVFEEDEDTQLYTLTEYGALALLQSAGLIHIR